MKDNFVKSLHHVLKSEGGFVDHPDDPGGVTNKGITARTYENFLGGPVDVQMMRDIPDNHVEEIYKDMYWEVVRADDLPAGVDLCVFDFGVNAGPVRSAKMLQSCVDATEDGVIGPKTLARVSEQDTEELIKLFSIKREEYYKSLRHFETFGRGWLRRNEDVRDTAIDMI
jgi:lysozyme family protein|tara:strand:- start:4048 stop:4557 length:510 start_codon:yes stop_codon:yes gene_type:complete